MSRIGIPENFRTKKFLRYEEVLEAVAQRFHREVEGLFELNPKQANIFWTLLYLRPPLRVAASQEEVAGGGGAKPVQPGRKLDVCPLCTVLYKMFERKRDRLLFRAQSKASKIEALKTAKPGH